MPRSRSIAALLVVLALAPFAAAPILGNGGKGKTTVFEAEIREGTGDSEAVAVTFTAELERILFALTSVRGKYKVIRIRIENVGRTALRLSSARDRIAVDLGGRTVAGILTLSASDRELWDSLPADLRTALAYPAIVEPGEQENVFVFVAEPTLTTLPLALRYRIDSRNLEVVLAEARLATGS